MKLWQAHAVFVIMGSIAAVPLTAPEGWLREDDNFVPFLNGEEGDEILSATAEFRGAGDGGKLFTFDLEVAPGPKDNEVTITLLDEWEKQVALWETTVQVPSPFDMDYAIAAHELGRLGLPVADVVAQKVTEYLTTREATDK